MRAKSLSLVFILLFILVPFAAVSDDGDGDGSFEFTGAIQSLLCGGLAGDWSVAGTTVHVTALTRIEQEDGAVAVGAVVEVRGNLGMDGSVDASRIEVKRAAPAGGPGPTPTPTPTPTPNPGPEAGEFRGVIQSLPMSGVVGDWNVGGTTVHVTAATRIEQEDGAAVVGAFVEVKGSVRADGSIDATEIDVKFGPAPGAGEQAEIRGAVQSLATAPGFIGDWMVSGTVVHVTASTRIDQEDGVLAVGALVEVKGTLQPDGSISATRIEVDWGPASAATASTPNAWLLPSSAHKSGRNGSFFTTELTLSNMGSSDATVTIKFLGHDRDGRQGPEGSLHLAAGATVTLSDVVGSFFGLADDFGAIRITSNVPTLAVRSRTMTPDGAGHFGQDLEAADRNDLVSEGRVRFLAGVREDAEFRTNLMLANATEEPLDVDVSLVAGDGSPLGVARVHLEPLEMRQINEVGHELAGADVRDARIQLSTSTKGGAFTAAASVIDNATNDPSAVAPR